MKVPSLSVILVLALLPVGANASLTVFGDDFEYASLTDENVNPGSLGPWSVIGSTSFGTFNPSGAPGSTWYPGVTGLTDTSGSGGVINDMLGPETGYLFRPDPGEGVQRSVGTIEANTVYEASIALSGGRTNGADTPNTYSIDLISGSTVLASTSGPSAGLLFEDQTVTWDSSVLPGGVNIGDGLTFRITAGGEGGGSNPGYLDFDNFVISETLVPEPSAALLLGLTGLGLLLRRRRD